MNNYKVRENESGFYIDYIYKENNNKKCLSLREDNDYFSFSLFSPFEKLNDIHTINIDSNSVMFKPIKKLIENNDYVEILEEGTNEGKSIIWFLN